ncbi:MAG: archease [Candidatus Brennerbacteria bacterium]|nr:archease [Candidatus Brennerbacteria bacterium]
MKRYQVLPHIADLRLKIYGKDMAELFENAALGLAHVLSKDAEKKLKLARGAEKITVEADEAGTLLISFLNRILSVSNINKKVYPKVRILYFSPQKIEAQISGIAIDGFDEDVKAVSYHDAKIEKNKDIFETTIVLDI